MGTKLNTRPPLDPTPLVNVKGKEGQTFIGKYIGVRTVDMSFGPRNVYEFQIQDGDMPTLVKQTGSDDYKDCEVKENEKVAIFAPTRLDTALKQAKPGQTIKITYLGLGKKPKRGGNKPHEYDVEVVE